MVELGAYYACEKEIYFDRVENRVIRIIEVLRSHKLLTKFIICLDNDITH